MSPFSYDGGKWMSLGEFTLEPSSGHKVVLTQDAAANVQADAVRFERIGDARLVQADAVRITPNTAEDALYVHTDHLGAPRKMTDEARAVVWDADFRPFGEVDSITGTAANDNRFPGQYADAIAALHYNYYRDYDPTLGRYLQSDPIGLRGGLNTYGYVGGNPVNRVDPTGEIGIVGGVYGAISGGVGGYISSGGTLRGTLLGAGAGAFVGFINPFSAYTAGAIGGNIAASLVGQFAGTGFDVCKLDKLDYLAAIGAGLGGLAGKPLGTLAGRFLPVGRPAVVGNLVRTPVRRTAQNVAANVVEGASVGIGEKLGNLSGNKLDNIRNRPAESINAPF